MEKYIKIYSYKKIKVWSIVMDVFKLEDIALAEEEQGAFKILSGPFQGQNLKKLNANFAEHDYSCIPVTLVEKNLMTDFHPENTNAINLDNFLKKSKYQYYIVLNNGGKLTLQETDDAKVIEEFKHSLNPSVSLELSDLIDKSDGNRLIIGPDLVNKMLGNKENLPSEKLDDKRKFDDFKISEKYEELKRKIVGLDKEMKIILANINKNISLSYSSLSESKIKELKTGILIMGPRGTGKTFMVENMADLFGVPSTIEDATRYTPAAYQGADIEDMLMNLYANSGEEKSTFEHGIIFLDEIDKICKRGDPKDYALKENIQNSLLTILRGTIIHKKVRRGLIEETITLDTSKLTFVFSGAFEEIIDKDNITKEDLIYYGMIPQLADRIHLIIKTKNPSKENLKTALTDGEYSYLKLFDEYLHLYGKALEVDEGFIDYIVTKAYDSGTGYRALSTALTEYLNDFLYDLYDGKMDVVKLTKKAEVKQNEGK